MCLKTGSGSNCFKISIGTNGPRQTDGGIGKITGDVRGARYQTKSSASASYDNDALKMGIPGNDKLGKWIHKTRNCSSGGTNSTLGCVAVPCDKWPEFKQFAVGKSLKVCGGGNMSNGYGRSSGRSDTSVDGASGSSR